MLPEARAVLENLVTRCPLVVSRAHYAWEALTRLPFDQRPAQSHFDTVAAFAQGTGLSPRELQILAAVPPENCRCTFCTEARGGTR